MNTSRTSHNSTDQSDPPAAKIVILCEKPGHEKQTANLVCTYSKCSSERILCSQCLLKDHASHLKHCIDLYQFSKLLHEELDTHERDNTTRVKYISRLTLEIVNKLSETQALINSVFDELKFELQKSMSHFENKMLRGETRDRVSHDLDAVLNLAESILSHPSLTNANNDGSLTQNSQRIHQLLRRLETVYDVSFKNTNSARSSASESSVDSMMLTLLERKRHEEKFAKNKEKLKAFNKQMDALSKEIYGHIAKLRDFGLGVIPEETKKTPFTLKDKILVKRFQTIVKNDDERWGICAESIDAVSFDVLSDRLVFHGIMCYKYKALPESGRLRFEIRVVEGGRVDGKILLRDIFVIDKNMMFNMYVTPLALCEPVALDKRKRYTVVMISLGEETFKMYHGENEKQGGESGGQGSGVNERGSAVIGVAVNQYVRFVPTDMTFVKMIGERACDNGTNLSCGQIPELILSKFQALGLEAVPSLFYYVCTFFVVSLTNGVISLGLSRERYLQNTKRFLRQEQNYRGFDICLGNTSYLCRLKISWLINQKDSNVGILKLLSVMKFFVAYLLIFCSI
eukprot:TRINITY_DN1551_c0_g1_i1.p1 TRINITY_DN1551_c0_g1~~TRINITY_DN1551_c0_g1_i1.p1  ORF type:complete len:571 (+),score=34.74 TRINITY_DN1551_c0_g1_i1:114-1826(+)